MLHSCSLRAMAATAGGLPRQRAQLPAHRHVAALTQHADGGKPVGLARRRLRQHGGGARLPHDVPHAGMGAHASNSKTRQEASLRPAPLVHVTWRRRRTCRS